jgi:hypothetical protein
MEYTEAEYTAWLQAAFPEEILRGILLGVIDGYKVAPGVCKKVFSMPDRHDPLGMVRRGKINEQIRGVAELHSLLVKDEPNVNGSAYFLSVVSGRYRLVANLVCRKEDMVRPAKIRKLWARHNRDGHQGKLGFASEEDHPVPEDTIFLAILLHGPRGKHRDQPGFVDIVVPDLRFRKYMCRLRLFSIFPQIAEGLWRRQDVTRKNPTKRKRERVLPRQA